MNLEYILGQVIEFTTPVGLVWWFFFFAEETSRAKAKTSLMLEEFLPN